MMSAVIEALYIYDETNTPILEHTYCSRPPPATAIRSHFLAHPAPRPSLVYLPDTSPPVSVFSVSHSNLLFLVSCSTEAEPLLVLEFIHRVIDVLEEFIGAPLLGTKIQNSYDVVGQLLNEMCDAGVVSNTEPNALREAVDVPGWMGKLLSGVGLPGASQASALAKPLSQPLATAPTVAGANAPAIPWRRSGVRHTSNELYVDIVESLSVIFAPSGRPISALVHGTIVFTAKISGVPDLLLSLSAPGGQRSLAHKIELPVFHPCVRLARWREKPGALSFVPPDGRFILGGYEVNLLPVNPEEDNPSAHMERLFLPATVDIKKGLGPTGSNFEVRLTLNNSFPGASSRSGGGGTGIGRNGGMGNSMGRGSGTSTPSFLTIGGSSSSPSLDDVVVTVSIPPSVRNITDIQASRGEATFMPGNESLEWRVPTREKDGSISGIATLKGTILGPLHELDDDDDIVDGDGTDRTRRLTSNPLRGYYDETLTGGASYQASGATTDDTPQPEKTEGLSPTVKQMRKKQANALLMPSSASVSFSVRGWLPSGIRVDSLTVDSRRSRGLGEGVKPYKGVKYICVSRQGIETRC
ncbi:Mu like protein domain [Trichophyton rubrum]|nr:Mu like protein domain [Trichophyton rubrum]